MTSRHPGVTHLDEALFEMAHLIAGLFAVDGAVVLTKRLELLGFGAEISGALEPVSVVARALDAESEQTEPESTDGVGTRHRSVYRLCQAVHDLIAVVISQDGNALHFLYFLRAGLVGDAGTRDSDKDQNPKSRRTNFLKKYHAVAFAAYVSMKFKISCMVAFLYQSADSGGHTSGAQLRASLQLRRNWHRDKEVAGQNVVVKVTERRRKMKLVGGDPPVPIGPLPASRRDALNRLLEVP
jgi:hypothetical protein